MKKPKTPTPLPPSDQATRTKAITELSRSILVEAAAGTGKTRLLTDRIVHIVREGKAELTHVAAITFTEKAAGELKVKLRKELEKASKPNVETDTLTSDEKQRFAVAIKQLELAQVNTIHGFCAWLLKQRPVEAGIDPNFEVADALQSRLLRDEIWDEWFRAEASLQPPPPILRRALYNGLDLDKLHGLARKLCDHRDQIDWEKPSTKASDLDSKSCLTEAHRVLGEMSPLLSMGQKNNKPSKEHARIVEALVGAESLDNLAMEKRLLETLTFDVGKGGSWKHPEAFEKVTRLAQQLTSIRQKLAESLLRELLAWLRGFLAAYEQRKRQRALLDFEDLLVGARNLLRQNPSARRYFKERFRFILIDEFQDTDPAQVEMAIFLSETNDAPSTETDWEKVRLQPGKLFIVGDPKQSIYRFRRADIEIYENAKRLVCNGEPSLTIAVNFRTLPQITDWVNRAFTPLMHKPQDGFYQPNYVPLIAYRLPDDEKIRRVLRLTPTDEEKKLMDDGAGAGDVREMEAAALAQCLKAMQGTRRVFDELNKQWRDASWRDMAILFRSLNDLPIYERALEEFGVPYQVEGGKDYFKRPEVRVICSLLLCLDNPMNTRELVATLRSPLFGVADEEIFLWKRRLNRSLNYLGSTNDGNSVTAMRGSKIARAFASLRRLHETRNRLSFAAFLEFVYRELRVVELFSLMNRAEQRVANLRKLLDYARAAQTAGMTTLRELARHIRDVALDVSEEGQSPAAEADDDVVHIITMHKAKGLEWPIVAFADLGRASQNQRDWFLVNRQNGQPETKLGKLETTGFKSARDAEALREEAEELRLLYVAATRARDWLVIPWFATKNEQGSFYPALEKELAPAHLSPGDSFIETVDRRAIAATRIKSNPLRVDLSDPIGKELKAVTDAVNRRTQWLAARQSLLERISVPRPRRRPSAHGETATTTLAVNGLTGRQIGTVVHELLGTLDLKVDAKTLGLEAQRRLETENLSPQTRAAALALVKTAAASALFARLRRCDEVLREVPFCFEMNGEMVEGFMDLVFRENDTWFLADYKTDRVTAAELEQRVAFYRGQMETYATALSQIAGVRVAGKYLFFLSANQIVELSA